MRDQDQAPFLKPWLVNSVNSHLQKELTERINSLQKRDNSLHVVGVQCKHRLNNFIKDETCVGVSLKSIHRKGMVIQISDGTEKQILLNQR